MDNTNQNLLPVPLEIWYEIFSYLTLNEVKIVRLVSKNLKLLTYDTFRRIAMLKIQTRPDTLDPYDDSDQFTRIENFTSIFNFQKSSQIKSVKFVGIIIDENIKNGYQKLWDLLYETTEEVTLNDCKLRVSTVFDLLRKFIVKFKKLRIINCEFYGSTNSNFIYKFPETSSIIEYFEIDSTDENTYLNFGLHLEKSSFFDRIENSVKHLFIAIHRPLAMAMAMGIAMGSSQIDWFITRNFDLESVGIFYQRFQLKQSSFKLFINKIKAIKKFKLICEGQLDDEYAQMICEKLTELEVFVLNGCQFTPKYITLNLALLKNLKTFYFNIPEFEMFSMNKHVINVSKKSNQKLTKMVLNGQVPDNRMQLLITNLENIRIFINMNTGGQTLKKPTFYMLLNHFKKIEVLTIPFFDYEDYEDIDSDKCSSKDSECTVSNVVDISHLKHLKTIEIYEVGDCPEPISLAALSKISCLENVWYHDVNLDKIKKDDIVKLIKSCPNLKSLRLASSNFGPYSGCLSCLIHEYPNITINFNQYNFYHEDRMSNDCEL